MSRMEDEASSRRSVAELAGRFRGSAPPHDAAGQGMEKTVRRRPPRSLQLPEEHDQERPGVTSPLPATAKRNSALIEKLQANLALSPSALLPSAKSFRLLPPASPPPSPSSNPGTTVTTPTPTATSPVAASLLTEEELPVSFEDPPAVTEGFVLSNSNIKGRARHSLRRHPPSRHHRRSSSGEEGRGRPSDPDKPIGGGGGGGGEVFNPETGDSACPEKNESQDREPPEIGEDEEEREKDVMGGKEGGGSSSREEEEKTDLIYTDSKEEKMEATASCPSVR